MTPHPRTAGIRLRALLLDRWVAVDRLWRRDVPREVAFWRDYLESRGANWPQDYVYRLNPSAPLLERLIVDRLERLGSRSVSILDVGAGPLTALGKTRPGYEIRITAVDALAGEYDRLLDEIKVDPLVRTRQCPGEELVSTFGSDAFDVAYARNAVDHTAHPMEILRNMVTVVRPGGFVALRHFLNEGQSTGWGHLHQWNFAIEHGELIIWGRHDAYNVTRLLRGTVTVQCRLDPDSERNPWVTAVLTKTS